MKLFVSRRNALRHAVATLATIAVAGGSLLGGTAHAQVNPNSVVYTSTNAAAGNSVVAFPRASDGSLGAPTTYATGGTGSGAGLGNQGAVAVSANNRWLYVVNAGSADISVFRVNPNGLQLRNRVPSGGTLPNSLTVYGNLLYVLNSGAPNNITGFYVKDEVLTPIPNSTQPLSGSSTSPAEVGFDPFGQLLIVSERTTQTLNVFPVDASGAAGAAVRTRANGATPFGFGFDALGRLFNSEAAGNSLSSYFVSSFGFLTITPSASALQAAPCWVVVSRDGKFVWTGNAGASRSITAFSIALNGKVTTIGVVATGLNGCTDLATDSSGKYLYALENLSGSVRAFTINRDGTLTLIGSYGGLGAGFTGLIAR